MKFMKILAIFYILLGVINLSYGIYSHFPDEEPKIVDCYDNHNNKINEVDCIENTNKLFNGILGFVLCTFLGVFIWVSEEMYK